MIPTDLSNSYCWSLSAHWDVGQQKVVAQPDFKCVGLCCR